MSSHMLTDLEELCDTIALLHQGVLLFTGAPAALRRRYAGASLEQAFLAEIAGHERKSQ